MSIHGSRFKRTQGKKEEHPSGVEPKPSVFFITLENPLSGRSQRQGYLTFFFLVIFLCGKFSFRFVSFFLSFFLFFLSLLVFEPGAPKHIYGSRLLRLEMKSDVLPTAPRMLYLLIDWLQSGLICPCTSLGAAWIERLLRIRRLDE